MSTINKCEVHILVACADARDTGQVHIDAVDAATAAMLAEGVVVDYYAIRSPGAYVTPDVVMDIRNIVADTQRSELASQVEVTYHIHLMTHGASKHAPEGHTCHTHELEIEDGAPANCGMLHATETALELERLLLLHQPTFTVNGAALHIRTEHDIRALLRDVYAHDGYLAGDWIRSIDDLRTHTRMECALLQQLFRQDHYLEALDIKVTSNFNDYAQHRILRVDNGQPFVAFWARVLDYLDEHAEELGAMAGQADRQKPLAGLIAMSNTRQTPTVLAADYYTKHYVPEVAADGYKPNTIFALKGTLYDMPGLPFGPYVIGGFFFSVDNLGLRDYLVMGVHEAQTRRIMLKIHHDPLMNFIVQAMQVRLIPLNTTDLLTQRTYASA